MPATYTLEEWACLKILRALYEDENLSRKVGSGLSERYRLAADDWFLRGWPPGPEVKRHILRIASWRVGFWKFARLARCAWSETFGDSRDLDAEIHALWPGPGELKVLCVWGGEMGKTQEDRLNREVAPLLVQLLVPS